ncbi:MAG: fluoride efflux transporter CrcB [Propionicimonas sp.]|nr:fluoride efflux transporter CrcB [Propionicimonas sp.]
MTVLLVAVLGGCGAVARFLVDRLVSRHTPGARVPLGTIVINLTGAFLLGLITGWWAAHAGDPTVRLVLGTGFLGGYTTFSTASVEGGRLVGGRDLRGAVLHSGGMLVVSVAAAALGWWLGSL